MNEELQQALAEMITRSVAVAGDALAFTKEQLPEVVQQLLLWKMTLSIVGFSIGLLFLIASAVAFYKGSPTKKKEREAKKAAARAAYAAGEPWTRYMPSSSTTSIEYDRIMNDDGNFNEEFMAISVALGGVGITVALSNLSWLQIWLAPKVYLIEYAANLVM